MSNTRTGTPELRRTATKQLYNEFFYRLAREDEYSVAEWSHMILEELIGLQGDDEAIDALETARVHFHDYLENYDPSPFHSYDNVDTTATDLAALGVMPR